MGNCFTLSRYKVFIFYSLSPEGEGGDEGYCHKVKENVAWVSDSVTQDVFKKWRITLAFIYPRYTVDHH